MNKSYADVLESYMIAEEGLFSKIKDLFRKKSNKSNNPTSIKKVTSSEKSENDYYENTQNIINIMKEECPEVIEKEIALIKSELVIIKKAINTLSKNIKNGGFNFTTKYINEVLINSNLSLTYFLEELLPSKSPKKSSSDYEWCNDITVVDCNIYDWNEIEKNNTVNVRDCDEIEEYDKTIVNICKALDAVCSKLKCAVKSEYYGDCDDGPIVILLKPSDEFMKIAKSYGWHE